MKKIGLLFATIIFSLLFTFQNWALGQVAGDYQSVATGNWIDINTWERYGASGWATPTLVEGYPGEFVGTGAILIQSGDDVTISGLGLTTQPMGVLTIASSGQLSLIGSNNLPIFTLNTPEINVIETPISGLLYMEPQSILVLPEDAIILLGAEGLDAHPCNNNIEIWIGSQQVAACKGAPGEIFTFGELLGNGGTLNSIPTSNTPVCTGGTIDLFGNFSGAFGTTTPDGSITGVNYNWVIQPPGGGDPIISASQDTSIIDALEGTYEVSLTCITYNLDQEYSNSETFFVTVDPLPIPGIIGKNPVSTNETGVVYTTEPGMFNYNWSVTGGTIAAGGGLTDNTVTVSWGSSGAGLVQVNYITENGCTAEAQTDYPISILIKQSDANASWNLADTWYPSGVPTNLQNIIVNDSVIIDNSPLAICNNLTIDIGGLVEIGPLNALTVIGTLTNNVGTSGLVIKSNSNGTGSLIHNSDNVSGTVEQYTSADAWHYVSSSINSALSGVYLGIYLKPFDESIDDWSEYIVPTNIPLNVMQGYSAWAANTPTTVSFIGTLNNGSLNTAVTCRDYDPITEDGGWNLVGNPYPSAIDWDAAGWTKDNVDNTIYFWEGDGGGAGTGNYQYYIGSGGQLPPIGANDGTSEIPAMQGFFIHVINDGLPGVVNGTLGVTNNIRIHSNQTYYKESVKNEIPLICLQASNTNELNDETIIRFYSASTSEFDGEFDAFKLEGYLYPQLYSITSDKSLLAINTLPEYGPGTIIPLGFTSPDYGEYTITLNQFENFLPGVSLYLEDHLTQTLHNLTIDPVYVFKSSPLDEPERFSIHFTENQMLVNTANETLSTIYSFEKSVYIKLPNKSDHAVVNIFNMMGQSVKSQSIYDQEISRIILNIPSGYYLVTVQLGNQFEAKKVFIK